MSAAYPPDRMMRAVDAVNQASAERLRQRALQHPLPSKPVPGWEKGSSFCPVCESKRVKWGCGRPDDPYAICESCGWSWNE